MEIIDWILQDKNLDEAIKAVKRNKGAAGIDKMTVDDLDAYFALHRDEIKAQIREGNYKPSPVRRVYIPKKKRQEATSGYTDRSGQSDTTGDGTGAVNGL